jgi:glycosyltransferase involved in cell wall biosynthesis
MKICMIAYTHYPTDSRVRREAEALAGRGDQVDVICLGEKNSPQRDEFNGVRLEKIRHGRYRGSSTIHYLLAYLSFFVAAFYRVTRLYLKNRYQIVQVHTMPDFMVFAAWIPRLLGAKIILDVHDLMPELYQSKFDYPETHPLIRAITWAERASIRFAHRAIAVHQPHLQALCDHGNPAGKFIQLLNLADEDVFIRPTTEKKPEQDDLFRLIYHGTIAQRNGLEIAILAIGKLIGEIPNLRFEVTGDGDDVNRIMTLTEDLGLADYIQINKGMVTLEELVPRLRQADIGIVPLKLDGFTQYMLPVKLLEYVALGKPVICTRTDTIKTYFDDSMVAYFSSGNAEELAACIRELYHNPEKRKSLSNNADKFLKEYNWHTQKQHYYNLIDSLRK